MSPNQTAVWHQLTAEEAEAGLVDADVPVVRWWWWEGEAAGTDVLAGENACGVSICW